MVGGAKGFGIRNPGCGWFLCSAWRRFCCFRFPEGRQLYDLTAHFYYLIGFREWSYRKRAIRTLRLQPGASVVEIGCGSGLNLPLLHTRSKALPN
jgi:hypothetical protein